MQGIEVTFDDVSFEGGDSPQRVFPEIVPGAAALALAGAVSVWALHWSIRRYLRRFRSVDVRVDCDAAISKPFADIAIDANVLAQLKSTAPALASRRLRAGGEPRNRAPRRPFPTADPRTLFPGSGAPPGRRARLCRPGAMRPKSARRKAFPCRRLVRLGSARRRSPRRLSGAARDPISPSLLLPGRPIIATSSRNCLDGRTHPRRSSLRRPQRAPLQPNRWSRSNGSESAAGGLGRGPLFSFPSPFGNSAPSRQSPAMITIPPSMTSRPVSSICRTEQSSKPIRAWGRRSTIRATWPSARWARRRRMSTS